MYVLISEIIERLEQIKGQEGDLPVVSAVKSGTCELSIEIQKNEEDSDVVIIAPPPHLLTFQ